MGASKREFEQLKEKEMNNEMLWDTHEVSKEIKPIELSGDVAPEIFGIEPVKAQEMVSGLSTIFAEREVLKNAYLDVIELDINSENLPIFKELRLKIRDNRTKGIEKWHTANKAFYLAGGRFVDAIKNKEILENLQMEEKLMEGEKYFENIEKEKARLLNLERIEKIRPYVENADNMSFSEFDDESFDDFVFGKKTRFENEKKEREAEALRIENERLAEIEKQKAIQAENERLKKEAEVREKELSNERKLQAEKESKLKAENDAKLRLELEAKAKVEAELQAKKDAELKAENERKAIEEKAKKDAEKLAKSGVEIQLKTWIDTFNIEIPIHLKDNEIANDILTKFWQFKSWSKKQSEN